MTCRGRPGEVHGVVGHPTLVVAHHQGVAELDPEPPAVTAGELPQPLDQFDALVELQVVHESLGQERDVLVTEGLVEDLLDPADSQQGGIELDDHIALVTGHQMLGDRVDLVRGAPVESGERHRVCYPGGEVEVPQVGEGLGYLGPEGVDPVLGVLHLHDEVGDLLRGDPLQVVADRHVEDERTRIGAHKLRHRLPVVENPDHHPGFHVLDQGLLHPQFLAPLDVVADGLHVDAGTGYLQAVEHLDRLQFKEPRPSQPGQHDVLGHLAVGSGGRTHRGGAGTAQEGESQVEIGRPFPDSGKGQIEDPLPGLPFVGHPPQQHVQGIRSEGIGAG